MTVKMQKRREIKRVAADANLFLIEDKTLSSAPYTFARRLVDIVLAIAGFAIFIPLLIILTITIKMDSKGSVFYPQERVGRMGKPFQLLKLRTMKMDAEKEGPRWAETNDPRVTRVGKFLRKTRIDELPQLINVLKGEMSIIGPRPERPVFTEIFNQDTPGFINRLVVKPGLTGWAQVNGGYDISPEEKLAYDLEYIRTRNFLLDVKILILTFKIVLSGEGAR
nr:exopolysaccharide biosynthesis polyprenyl glycosylphosphotransferase [Thalassobacillus sp. CUG 92003]